MPGYLEKALTRFRPHYLLPSHRAAGTPGRYIPPSYGSKLPQLAPEDPTHFLSYEQKKEIQAIVGTILYYARAVDPTRYSRSLMKSPASKLSLPKPF